MTLIEDIINKSIPNIFKDTKKPELSIGRPYYLDFEKAHLLVADSWKEKVGGVPQGTFILAFYENENDNVDECLLLRAIKPSKLPTDNEMISSMVEYYKDNLETAGKSSQLDDYTKYAFSFSGLECRVLGTFFKNVNGTIEFGADVENFYSAHNYATYKPSAEILTEIVNFREKNGISGGVSDVRIGKVRYSSTVRFQELQEKLQKEVPVYVQSADFLGKRTALFGMTRTGKSNTVKKIIEATTEISNKAANVCSAEKTDENNDNNPLDNNGVPKYKVGQIIFDINGEYANANSQDDGTAIFEKFSNITQRYSVIEKTGFKVMKMNFYAEITNGFEFICTHLSDETSDYMKSFMAVNLYEPDKQDVSAHTRWQRKIAAYQCCLRKAGFDVPTNHKVFFSSNKEIDKQIPNNENFEPKKGIDIDKAVDYWAWVANNQDNAFFNKYLKDNGRNWIDDDLRAILVVLLEKRNLTGANISGFRKLIPIRQYHTNQRNSSFEDDIIASLRNGEIIIVDLSQGAPTIQKTFSEKICNKFFKDAMHRFINMQPNNFVQFYFEEAHNLFPQKDDKNLSQIYNRIAKEGAKLNIGLIYATQEVSSISSNILKNTQNWFISHLNNEDELKELRKFYDFADFCDSLIRYSSGSDKGFIRMKTYSNAFVVPVQVDKFQADESAGGA